MSSEQNPGQLGSTAGGSTPVVRPASDHTPAVLTPAPLPQAPAPKFGASFGWFLVLAATVLLAFASFDLYNDQASGMWAGYRDLFLVLVLGYSLALLRCDVPRTPFIGICGVVGVLLILEGIFLGATTAITFTEVATGIVMVIGVAFMVSAAEG